MMPIRLTVREIADYTPEQLAGWVFVIDDPPPPRDTPAYNWWALALYRGAYIHRIKTVRLEGDAAYINGGLFVSADSPVFWFGDSDNGLR